MIDAVCRESADVEALSAVDFSAATGRLLAWYIEGPTLAGIGLRVLVSVHKLRPDLIGGMSFREISAPAGFCRSAAHSTRNGTRSH